MYKVIIKFILRLHTFFYRLSGIFSVKAEGGVHPKHRLMDYHRFFIDNINLGDNILDIGCGNGFLAYDLAKKAKMVVGIDLDERSIGFAKKRFSASNIKYLVGDALKDLPVGDFDAIVLSNVLEHIEDRVKFLKEIKTKAKKILIRVPMINRDWITLYKKELGLEWKSDRSHFTEYTLESFKNELEKAGLNLIKYSIQFGEIWAISNKNILVESKELTSRNLNS